MLYSTTPTATPPWRRPSELWLLAQAILTLIAVLLVAVVMVTTADPEPGGVRAGPAASETRLSATPAPHADRTGGRAP